MPARRRSIARREMTPLAKMALFTGGRHWRQAFGDLDGLREAMVAHPEQFERPRMRCPRCAGFAFRDSEGVQCVACGVVPIIEYLEAISG